MPNPVDPILNSRSNPNLIVSALIDEDTKSWRHELVNAFFTPQNAKNILDSRIPFTGEDKLIWPYSKNGQFSVKTAYKVISGEINHMNTNQGSNPVYKAIWNLSILPKVQLFIWKCYEKILPAKSVLARYNNAHDSYCTMCNVEQIETLEHIILQCLFAKYVWSLTPYADLIEHDRNSSISIHDWVSKWLTDNSLNDRAGAVFTIVWSIWKDRCFHIFRGKL